MSVRAGSGRVILLSGQKITLSPNNLFTYPNDFDNAAWTKNTVVTVTPNSILAPDGTLTADNLVETVGTGAHWLSQSIAVTDGVPYKQSFYVRPNGRNYGMIRSNLIGGTYNNVGFDFSAVSTTYMASGYTGRIKRLVNGWFKITATATASGTASRAFTFQFSNVPVVLNTDYSYTGDGSSGFYIWGAELLPA